MTTYSAFWLELATTKGSMETQSKKKKLYLKFLGTTKGDAMANVTTKIKIKNFHFKSKTINFQVSMTQQ
jgi:hypothetical protein